MKQLILLLSLTTTVFCSNDILCFGKDVIRTNKIKDDKLYVKVANIITGCYNNNMFTVIKESITEEATLTVIHYEPVVEIIPGSYCICPLKKK